MSIHNPKPLTFRRKKTIIRTVVVLLLIPFLALLSLSAQSQERANIAEHLRSEVVDERIAALRQLEKRPSDLSVMELLMDCLRHPSPRVRLEALKTWGKVGKTYDRAIYRANRSRPQFSREESSLRLLPCLPR